MAVKGHPILSPTSSPTFSASPTIPHYIPPHFQFSQQSLPSSPYIHTSNLHLQLLHICTMFHFFSNKVTGLIPFIVLLFYLLYYIIPIVPLFPSGLFFVT